MIIPIRCFTCGKPLAAMFDYYSNEVAKLEAIAKAQKALEVPVAKVQKGVEVPVAKVQKGGEVPVAKVQKGGEVPLVKEIAGGAPKKLQHFDEVKTKKIFEDLGLKRYCCRRHMLGQVDMMDII